MTESMDLDMRVLGVGGVALGIILVFAGLLKLFRGTAELERMIGHLLPILARARSATATVVVVAEMGIGAWLITGIERPYALGGALCLVSVFTLVLGLAAVRRHDGECGCFGGSSGSALLGIVRNLFFIGLLGAQWALEVQAGRSPTLGSMSMVDVLMGVLWGCFAVMLFRTLAWLESVLGSRLNAMRYGSRRRERAD